MDFTFIEDEAVRATAVENYNADQEEKKVETQKMIEESVTGLKSKNDDLLNEKKKVQEALKNFDGVDADKAKEALKFLEENADAQLIKDGKIEELLDRKTSSLRTEHETAIETITEQLLNEKNSNSKFKGLYESKLLDDALTKAAITAKVTPTAINDILLNGKGVFSISEDGSIEARDVDGKVMKTEDGIVLNTSNWIEGKKESNPHWWGASESGDLTPGDPNSDDYNTALRRAADAGDNVAYRKLRDKRKK